MKTETHLGIWGTLAIVLVILLSTTNLGCANLAESAGLIKQINETRYTAEEYYTKNVGGQTAYQDVTEASGEIFFGPDGEVDWTRTACKTYTRIITNPGASDVRRLGEAGLSAELQSRGMFLEGFNSAVNLIPRFLGQAQPTPGVRAVPPASVSADFEARLSVVEEAISPSSVRPDVETATSPGGPPSSLEDPG